MDIFDELKKRYRIAITTYLNLSEIKRVADFSGDLIRRRTRLGYGVKKEGGTKGKLKELSDSYKARRRKKASELHSETTPARSNLTYTGQMLDSIYAQRVSLNEFVLSLRPYRKPVPTKKKNAKKRQLTNEQVAEFNEQKGRTFFNLSRSELRQVEIELRESVRKALIRGLR